MDKSPLRKLCAHFGAHKSEWLMFTGFLLANIFVSTFFKAPFSYPDEYGVLSTANWVYGGTEWGIRISNHYYGYTTSLLIGLFFRLFDDFGSVFFGAQCVLSVLVSLIPVFCHKILNEVLKVKSARIRVLLSLAVGLYPAFTIYAKRVANEPPLFLSMFISLYLIGKCVHPRNTKSLRIYSALLGLFPIVAYASHGMGLAIVAAVFMSVLASHVALKRKLVSYPFFLGSLALFFIIDSRLKALIIDSVYVNKSGIMKNTFMYSFTRMLNALFEPVGIKTLIKTLVAKFHYLSSATYGLMPLLGILLLIFACRYLYKRFSRKEKEAPPPEPREQTLIVLTIFSILVLICGVALSSLNHIGAIQLRQGTYYVYARYYEYMVLPLILVGIYYVLEVGVRNKTMLITAGTTVVGYILMAAFVERYVVPYMMDGVIKRHTVYGVLPFLDNTYAYLTTCVVTEDWYNVLHLGLVCMGVFALLLFLLIRKHGAAALAVLMACFFLVTSYGIWLVAIPGAEKNQNRYFAPMYPLLEGFKNVEEIYDAYPNLYLVTSLDRRDDSPKLRPQLVFFQYAVSDVMTFKEWKKVENPEEKFDNAVILSEKDHLLETLDPSYQKIYQSEDATVWIRGDEIQKYWAENHAD